MTCTPAHSGRIIDPDTGSIEFKCLPFDLENIKLLEVPFRHATELNIQSLLNYEPNRFLAKFRMEAGLDPKAEHYHGCEDQSLAGHSLGGILADVIHHTDKGKYYCKQQGYNVWTDRK